MNISLQMKLIQKILTEQSNIWVRLVIEKYRRDNNVLEINKKKIFWQFSRFLNIRDDLKKA